MVIFGGLEVLAAGYLVHQHQQNKKERQRQEEEDEEYERRRAERHARRRERRDGRREKRSESAPPSPTHRRGLRDKEKYTYSSPQPVKAQPVSKPQPAQYWVPPGPPPPMQYTPQHHVISPRLPPRQAHSVSPPVLPSLATTPVAPPRIPLPPLARPSPPLAATSVPSVVVLGNPQYAAQSQRVPPPPPQPQYYAPPNTYEMNGGDVPSQYLYANTHTPDLRTPSPPLGERTGERPILRTGDNRRARSNSRVRFALPVEGDEGRLVEVAPSDPLASELPGSPPPPYRP